MEVDGAREAAVDPRDEGGDLAAARVDVVGPRVGDDAVELVLDGRVSRLLLRSDQLNV